MIGIRGGYFIVTPPDLSNHDGQPFFDKLLDRGLSISSIKEVSL